MALRTMRTTRSNLLIAGQRANHFARCMRAVSTGLAMAFLGFSISGCGSDGSDGNEGAGGVGGNADPLGVGGNADPLGVGGNADPLGVGGSVASGPIDPKAGFRSNLPSNAAVEISATDAANGVELLSLNLVPDPDSSLNYTEWFGELRNVGTNQLCLIHADFTMKDATGQEIWSGTTFPRTASYITPLSTVSTTCLAPGEAGVIWTNVLPDQPISVASVAELSITFDAVVRDYDKFERTLTASVVEDPIYRDEAHWAMRGSYTPSQTVYNVLVDGFFRSSAGFIVGKISSVNSETVSAGTTWTIVEDYGIEIPKPIEALAFDEFIMGAKPPNGFGFVRRPPVLPDATVFSLVEAMRATRDATFANRDLADAARRAARGD